MAKRYYQSNKDRKDESRGMRYHEERVHNPGINHEPDKFNDEKRRDKDRKDGAMGFDNRLAIAANVMNSMQVWSHVDAKNLKMLARYMKITVPLQMTGPYMPEGLDDTIRGVDMQMDYDDEQRREHFYPKKV